MLLIDAVNVCVLQVVLQCVLYFHFSQLLIHIVLTRLHLFFQFHHEIYVCHETYEHLENPSIHQLFNLNTGSEEEASRVDCQWLSVYCFQ